VLAFPGSGHACIINIDARAVSNPTTNSDTPPWVFGPTSLDVAFCGGSGQGYYGSTVDNVEPPTDAYTNINTSNCVNATPPHNLVQCTAGTLATGIPAVWETPFQTAVVGWWDSLITWASGNSEWATAPAPLAQIDYVRFGFSIGSEATINCTQYLEGALGGGDALMKTTWLGAYATAASDISSERATQFQLSPQFPPPNWVPMMTVNMGQSLTSYPGGTDPSWSIEEAKTMLANQPFAIGTQGLENGTPGSVSAPLASDLFDIQLWNTCTGSNCCSDNWCNVRQMVIGQVPFIELQDCNISTAGGGGTYCLDASQAKTGTSDQTLSQVFVLSSEQGTTSAEIYYQDLQCAVGLGTGSCSGLDQTSYKAAIVSLAAGQPAAASVLFGTANAVGTTQIF